MLYFHDNSKRYTLDGKGQGFVAIMTNVSAYANAPLTRVWRPHTHPPAARPNARRRAIHLRLPEPLRRRPPDSMIPGARTAGRDRRGGHCPLVAAAQTIPPVYYNFIARSHCGMLQ